MNYVLSLTLGVFFSLVLFPVPGSTAQQDQTAVLDGGSNLMLKSKDLQFVMNMSQIAAGAKALSARAASRSSNENVVALSKQFSADYDTIHNQMEAIAEPMRLTLPNEIPSSYLSAVTSLQNERADKVDRKYLKTTVKQAEQNIKSCKSEIQKGTNKAIRKFAVETLAVLEDHLERAQILYRALEKKKT